MSEAKSKYVLRVVFSPEQADAITKICDLRSMSPEVFVRYAALDALTVAMLADGLPPSIRDSLREWNV